jgi:hypothetical protein
LLLLQAYAKGAKLLQLPSLGECWHPWCAELLLLLLLLLQAFAKDAKLLQLLKALITQQSQLAATPATQLTADMVQQLQQVVQEAEVKSPEAFKLDADQVRSLTRQPSVIHASNDPTVAPVPDDCEQQRASWSDTRQCVRVRPARPPASCIPSKYRFSITSPALLRVALGGGTTTK